MLDCSQSATPAIHDACRYADELKQWQELAKKYEDGDAASAEVRCSNAQLAFVTAAKRISC